MAETLNSLSKTRRFPVDMVLLYENFSLFSCLTFGVHSTGLPVFSLLITGIHLE